MELTRCDDCPFVMMCDLNGCMKDSAREHFREYFARPEVKAECTRLVVAHIKAAREARS